MIAFDGPEGQQLRALRPSQTATMALWLAALREGDDAWSTWAQSRLADIGDSLEILALRFMQAVSDQDVQGAKQRWAILESYQIKQSRSAIVTEARTLRAQLPF